MTKIKTSELPRTKSSVGVNKTASKSNPQTMEELLASTGYQVKGLKRGETISGVITSISTKAVLIDIGAKTEGMVVERGFEAARDYIQTLKVGDKVSAQVVAPESDYGYILLSLKRTASTLAWQKLAEAKLKDEPVTVLVTEISRAGLVVETCDLTGFIPSSQLASVWQGKEDSLMGKKMEAKVIEINEVTNKLILSEKAVSEKEKMAEIEKAIKKIKIGEEYDGVVSGLTSFGVFVQIEDKKNPGLTLEGLVHISEVAWEKVDDPSLVLKSGQQVKVKVIGVDEKANKLALSLKQLQSDPWQEIIKKYPLETKISGKISRLTAFGAFVEIEPGLEGLLHISKIPAEKKIDVGDKVDCFVEAIEADKRRLSLGLVLKAKPMGYK